MRALAALCCAAALAVASAGCSLGGDDSSDRAARTDTGYSAPPAARPHYGEPREAAAIRAWSRDVSAGRYARAARYFVPRGAVVDQGTPVRLPDRAAVIAFNRSLPCRSTVSDVRRSGRHVLATFVLRAGTGPASACQGSVRVRFTFRRGRFLEFVQLPDNGTPAPQGDVT